MSKETNRFSIANERQFPRGCNHEVIHISGGTSIRRRDVAQAFKEAFKDSKLKASFERYSEHAYNVYIRGIKNYASFIKFYKKIKSKIIKEVK